MLIKGLIDPHGQCAEEMWARVLEERPVRVATEEEVLDVAVVRESVNNRFEDIRR
jgi:hypothetical protein